MELYGASLTLFEENATLLDGLDEGYRRAWYARHGNPENRAVIRAGLAGLWLLQQAGYVGELAYDDNGRPMLVGKTLDFNISHTENYVFCAITESEGRVGLDAEEPKRMSSLRSLALAERWFVGGERLAFARNPSLNHFLEIWTRKEAFLKWTGEGLRGVKSMDVTEVESRCDVRFYDFSTDNVIVTLCCNAEAESPRELVWVQE
jgi:4'-phosphopantetheinyl transferase